ncbi:amidase, partial [Enterococcus faecium]
MNVATEFAKELKEKEFSFQELVSDIQKKIKKLKHELNSFVALEPFESNTHE